MIKKFKFLLIRGKFLGFSRSFGRFSTVKPIKLLLSLGLPGLAGALLLTGCATVGGEFDSASHPPKNPNNVRVKVSLQNRMAYVMEGNDALMVTPVAIGKAGHETPRGHFKAYNKIARKRSGTYGFHVRGSQIKPGKSANTPRGSRYVGYPMPYWVEFKSGYGFHAGSVWPQPRTHGCLRLHPNVAPKFFNMVRSGTPIHIAYSQPEDRTLGRNVARPTDYADPDPPASYMISGAALTNLYGN